MLEIILISIAIIVLSIIVLYNAFPAFVFHKSLWGFSKFGRFSEKTIEIDGIAHSYFDNHKKNKPIAIFLHGFTDKKESWFPFILLLAHRYRIIMPDLIGHGKNVKDENISYTFEMQAKFVQHFASALNIQKFHLVGVSMGGAVAGKFAELYQENLLSLTMMSNAGINGNLQPSKMEHLLLKFESYEDKKREIPILPLDMSNKSMKLFKEYLFYNKTIVPNKMFREFMRNAVQNRDFYIKIIEDFLDTESGKFIDPIDEHLKDIHCPVLVIWGKEDAILHHSSVDILKQNLPNQPEVLILDKCGHGSFIEHPTKVKKVLCAFLDKHS